MSALLAILLFHLVAFAAPPGLISREVQTCPPVNCSNSFTIHESEAIAYQDSVVDTQFVSFHMIQTPEDSIAISVASRLQVGFQVVLSVNALDYSRSIDVPPGQSFRCVGC